MGPLHDTLRASLPVGLCTVALLLAGVFARPNPTVAQDAPEVSFPITVSTDAGGSQELSLGLDPSATAGIDSTLGEQEQPPLPPSDIFDARLIDDDIPPTGFGEGLVDDFRQGSASFSGAKEHEIQIQPDSGATEVTISWSLPSGVTGTLTDVITDGGIVDESMSGSGSYTLTNLDVTKLYVTLEYSGEGNSPPNATDDNYSVVEDSTLSITDPANGVLANDTDLDGDSLTASLGSDVSNGALTFNADGTFEYTPDPGFVGTDNFTYEVSDGDSTDQASVSIAVLPEGATAEVQFPITVSTNDGDSQALSLGLDPEATPGIDSVFGETEQPPPPPSDIFDARLIDDDVPPTGFGQGLLTDIRQGTADFTGTKEHEIQVQPGDNVDSVTVSWTLPPGVTGQLQDVTTDGGIVDEPMTGSGSFTFTNLNVTKLLVALTYGAPNTPPAASDDGYSTIEGQGLQVDPANGVLANDTDPDGDSLGASVVSAPSNGVLSLNPDGSFTYTPNTGFTGTDIFTYQAADGRGGTAQATATIEVLPQQPAAIAFPFTVAADTSTEQLAMGLDPDATDGIDPGLGEQEQPPLPPSGVFDARWIDTDVPASGFGEGLLTDIRPGDSTFVGTKVHEVKVQPGGAADSVTFSWSLPPGVTGTLTDVVTEGDQVNVPMEGSGSYTLTNLDITKLYVTLEYALGNAPDASPDSYSTPEDSTLTVPPPGVLGNDTDPNGDPLTAALLSGVSNGSLTLNADGSFEYTPDSDFTGTDSFTYEAADGTGETDQATATIEVVEGDSVTVQIDDVIAAPEDTVTVPIQIGNLNAVAGVLGYGFELDFDESVLSYVGFEEEGTLTEAAGFLVNENSDIPRIGAAGSTPLNDVTEGGSGTMLKVKLAVETPDSATVTLDTLQFNEGNVPAAPPQPSFLIDATLLAGDVSEDGQVTPFDASLALRFFLDLTDLTPRQQRAADLSGDDQVTPFDASLILQEFLGIRSATSRVQIAGRSKASATQASAVESPVRLGDPRVTDGRAKIPVLLSDRAAGIQSLALSLETRSEESSVKIAEANAPEGWMTEHTLQEDGTMQMALAGPRGIDGPRKIATVTLNLSDADTAPSVRGHARWNGGAKVSLGRSVPTEVALDRVYPNPVRQSATVEYRLPDPRAVTVTVYDLLGRKVATPVEGKRPAGRHKARINASQLPSGTYFLRMKAGSFTATRKLTVTR